MYLLGKLYPHDIPHQKWQVVSMDFIIGFPKIKYHHNGIFFVIDKLTKVTHFMLGNAINNALTIANKYIK